MKNKLLAIALATASFAAIPAFAADSNGNGGFFVNGNVGQSNLDKGIYNDNDTGYGVNAGYRWSLSPSFALGLEGGYTDLGKFDTNHSIESLGDSRASVKGWTAGVNGHFNLTPQWYVSGRAGVFNGDVKGFAQNSDASFHYVDDTATKFYAGAGFGYDFSSNLSVGLNYDYYKVKTDGLNLDPNLVSISGEYRF